MQELKDKKITPRVINVKTSNCAKETTKAKNRRKNTLESLEGIQKTPEPEQPVNMDQYMWGVILNTIH